MQSHGYLAMALKLQFDPNQKHQLDAVESMVRLFDGMSRYSTQFTLGDEVSSNLPRFENLNEEWLYSNLERVQQGNFGEERDRIIGQRDLMPYLQMDSGMVLEGIGHETWRHPNFTIEMETGTGKTYVYLRTVHELRQHYGFSKFIVVVPSIAIYEGVIKNFQITKSHFAALYGNETINLIEYDGSRLSQLRAFASSTFVEIMVITLDSINKASNVIYKPSEKLSGERLPYQYIQETRPILILDEPQNMESEKAKEALRTLHPLFALRYSATHRTSPNLIYRLSPFDAYRQNLVKKIQVYGVTEHENFNQPFLSLQEISLTGGIKAHMKAYVEESGRVKPADFILKHGEDLYEKTKREEHKGGYKVVEINAAEKFIEFENGLRLEENETIGPSRPDIFRVQIRKTLEQHLEMQDRLSSAGIKVLSLFFIDRVANYTSRDGIIKRIFDEEFEQIKGRSSFYQDMSPMDVREAYFAQKKPNKGEIEGEAYDTESRTVEEREAEKKAFVLIMWDKERLLSFSEKKCFIFAHSALKEGWDNPNVFQICTLNQTVSEIKKRQEIGRGLRLAVNQQGDRVFDEEINILSVIANESYQSYAANLQSEYRETGDAPPPPPRDGYRRPAMRNEKVFTSQVFRDFWARLEHKTSYRLHIDTSKLVQECIGRINNKPTPQAVIVVEKGQFVVTEYVMQLEMALGNTCRLRVTKRDTDGNETVNVHRFNLQDNLGDKLTDERLRDFRIVKIEADGENSQVTFSNNVKLDLSTPQTFQSEAGQQISERAVLAPLESYPVFNLIDRAAKEIGLTCPTINLIFKGLTERKKQSIFANPEGFASLFIGEIQNELADHVAERIEFVVDRDASDWGYDLEDLFPDKKTFSQRELLDASSASIYDQIQVDSDVEKRFVQYRLLEDNQVIFYFKFPPKFEIKFPKVIGNYNPDWGIARYAEDGKIVLELVRETKGGLELEKLRFPQEKRKIECAKKHFNAVGIDYRVLTGDDLDWWKAEETTNQGRFVS
jgi:type III restriction enzyme